MQDFNERQKEAIYSENKSILASAGAGAGKTSVMSERVIDQILNHDKTIDQMLVVTFTNEAAFSMKDKIRKRLNDIFDNSANITQEQRNKIVTALMQLHSANISTIHSFCSNILKNGYMLVGIDPTFTIVEDTDKKDCFVKAVKQALENISSKSTPAADKRLFGYFKRSISANKIVDLCSEIHDTLMGIPDPYDHMHKLISDITLPLDSNPWAMYIKEYNILRIRTITSKAQTLESIVKSGDCHEKALPFVNKDITVLKELEKALAGTPDIDKIIKEVKRAYDASPDTSGLRLGKNATEVQVGVYNQFKEIHSEIKSVNGVFCKVITALKSVQNPVCAKDNIHIQCQLFGLEVLMREVGKCFTQIKNDNNVLYFSDLEQMAYTILTDTEHPEVRDSIREKFTDIFVDECQDVSGIQYAIIESLKAENTNTFYVGDLKQSIYRFRHADPLLFLGLRERYQEDKDADERLIYFQHNYRSSATILECVNRVFSSCMNRNMTEIDYEKGDHLLVGKSDIPCALTDVIVIDNNTKEITGDETKDKIEAQCSETAKMIHKYLDEGYSYKDIVILMRSTKTNAPKVRDWLTKLHIPVYYQGKYSFYKVPEVALFIDLLRCIDNSHMDIPLIATIKNPPFDINENELAEISTYSTNKYEAFYLAFDRCAENNSTPLEKKCHNIRETLNEWRSMSNYMTASEMIWMLLKDYNIYSCQSAMPGGDMRQKNLSMLHQKAITFEKTDKLRLSDFLAYISKAASIKTSGGDSSTPLGENDDFVRIMSIHKSKGLEFPVVIILDTHRNIHSTPDNNAVFVNIETNTDRKSLGFYTPFSYKTGNVYRHTFGLYAFTELEYMNELAEETRMLYVAMTRAKERLLLIGCAGASDENRWLTKNNEARIFSTKTMMDMFMPSAMNGRYLPLIGKEIVNDCWRVYYTRPMAADISSIVSATRTVPDGIASTTDYNDEWDKIGKDATTLPAKTTVTSVIKGHFKELTENDSSANNDDDTEDLTSSILPDEYTVPKFMSLQDKETSAGIGTVMHRFMRLIDFSKFNNLVAKNDYIKELENELDYMVRQDIFNTDEAQYITDGIPGISMFLMSKLGERITDSKLNVMREKAFTVRIHVKNEDVFVQGVIDVLYMKENGHWIIVDYKTDHDTREQVMKEKHTDQLNCYRMAIERATGIPVDGMWIAALRDGSCYQVDKVDKNICH